jgi:hypothetical protein
MKRSLIVLVAALALAGCGGGGGSSATPAAGATATQTKTSSGTLLLSIPLGTTGSASHVRYPQFVSPGAVSVTLSINGGALQTFDVSATSSICQTIGGSRLCTLSFNAPPGSDAFTFKIYNAANGTGTLLASGTSTISVVLGTPFAVTVAMNPVIGLLSVNASNPTFNCPNAGNTTAGTIVEGCAGTTTLTFTVMDPSGNTITGSSPFAQPIQITANDPSLSANPTTIQAPGVNSLATYSGAAFGSSISNQVTVTLTVGTTTFPVPITVKRQYLYVANSNAPPGMTPTGGGNVVVYTYGASGSPTPVRTISGANTTLTNPVDVKLDASGNLYVLDNGPYTTHSNPFVAVFAPGVTGNVAPIRTISGIATVSFNFACEMMQFDPSGVYLDIMCDDSSGTIHVFNASANGTAAAAHTIDLNNDGAFHVLGFAFDTAGDLYTTDVGAGSPGQAAIVETVAPISQTGITFQLYGASKVMASGSASFNGNNQPMFLAFDSTGNLYATIGYYNSTSGASDATNELAMWSSSSIPCSNCAPATTLTGTPFTIHNPAGIALDAAGNAYVSNPFPLSNAIYVFSRTSVTTGGASVSPAHTLNGLLAPNGMVIGP